MAEIRQITFAELQDHKAEDDLWLLIDGEVYDVTKFMPEHPGGDDVLVEEGGKDATDPFEDIGHSDDARDMLKPMHIGTLADPESVPSRGAKASDVMAASSGGGPPLVFILGAIGLIGYLVYTNFLK
ncbi:hypothetical protein MSPP1_001782 [Malassezia sp. CBS 17886]|nr:hypothetical protein MSPP1_001782 [Malassezia sp. CBS 17886]